MKLIHKRMIYVNYTEVAIGGSNGGEGGGGGGGKTDEESVL